LKVGGVVLADQFKSLDWAARKVVSIGGLPTQVVDLILVKAKTLL